MTDKIIGLIEGEAMNTMLVVDAKGNEDEFTLQNINPDTVCGSRGTYYDVIIGPDDTGDNIIRSHGPMSLVVVG